MTDPAVSPALAVAIATEQSRGAQLVTSDANGATLIVSRPKRVRHVLHAILSILTGGFWLIIWLAVYLTSRNKLVTTQIQLALGQGGAIARTETKQA